MKKDSKEINGKMVFLTKGDVCKKCEMFDTSHNGDCLAGSNTECMDEENKGKVWKLAHPIRDFFETPIVKFYVACFLGLLLLFLMMAGESIINNLLDPLKH